MLVAATPTETPLTSPTDDSGAGTPTSTEAPPAAETQTVNLLTFIKFLICIQVYVVLSLLQFLNVDTSSMPANTSSYDDDDDLVERRQHRDPHNTEQFISMEQYKAAMRLVRLQIAVPISVLVALGTAIITSTLKSPSLKGISQQHPTLLSPNYVMFGLYWAVLFMLEIGFCLLLVIALRDETKDTLTHGVGLRIAVVNWLLAFWCVFWSLELFKIAGVVIILAALIVITIQLTLIPHPVTYRRPFDAIFIHAPMGLLLAMLFELMWMHNGMVALGWVISDTHKDKWMWPALGCLVGVNVAVAIWEAIGRHFLLSIASEYILFTLLFSQVRINPILGSVASVASTVVTLASDDDDDTSPRPKITKPVPLLAAIIACLVLHPFAIIIGTVLKRGREREGRIRLEEEADEAEARAREAEVAAQRARARAGRERAAHGEEDEVA